MRKIKSYIKNWHQFQKQEKLYYYWNWQNFRLEILKYWLKIWEGGNSNNVSLWFPVTTTKIMYMVKELRRRKHESKRWLKIEILIPVHLDSKLLSNENTRTSRLLGALLPLERVLVHPWALLHGYYSSSSINLVMCAACTSPVLVASLSAAPTHLEKAWIFQIV